MFSAIPQCLQTCSFLFSKNHSISYNRKCIWIRENVIFQNYVFIHKQLIMRPALFIVTLKTLLQIVVAWRQSCINWNLNYPVRVMVRVVVFNATFNNISVISWRSILLVEETGVPGENHRPVASHWQTLSHNVVSSTPRHERDSNLIYVDMIFCLN